MERGKFFEVKKGYVIGVVIMAFLTLAIVLSFDRIEATWRTVFSRFEPVNVGIFTQGEIQIPEYLPASEAPCFYVVIEGVADEDGNMPPTAEETRILYETMEEIDDALDVLVFTHPGVFRYRVSIEASDELVSADGLTLWEIDDHFRYYTVVVEAQDGVLEVSTYLAMYDGDEYLVSIDFDDFEGLVEDEHSRDVIFVLVTMRYVSAITGIWEHGTGDWGSGASGRERNLEIFATHIEFISMVDHNQFYRRDWRLTSDRQMEVNNFNDDGWDAFDVELIDDRLFLTDVEGNQRFWWREGTREEADEVFIGTWQFSHGTRFWGRDREMIFKGNHQLVFTEASHTDHIYWELNSNNQIFLESTDVRRLFWELDASENILTITTEDGYISVWTREGTNVTVDDNWLIADYLGYFDMEVGYNIVHNERMVGETFEFVIYEIEREDHVGVFYHVIVVKKAGEVFDVIEAAGLIEMTRDRYWQQRNIGIDEMDLTFNGEMDILINYGYVHYTHISGCGGDMYSGFVVKDERLVEAFSHMCWIRVNPSLEMLMLRGGINAHGREFRLLSLVNEEFMEIGSLIEGNWHRGEDRFYKDYVERLLINGEWVESRLCWFNLLEDWDEHLCDETYDELLYERIHGENGLWNVFENEDWIYIGDLIQNEE